MTDKQELSFEEAMKELESLVEKLEEGDVPLERAITYYQDGMKLSKLCNDKLKNVQEKMTTIMNEQGDLEPFHVEGEE
ncbi:exodeoxyribonuclease 7 small subunit [Oceanobacillus picturae]|jgi:exodeoxyribonuclease VII small subunit|uniref:Exodeoxyribonuclease 7 small subunit n=2 Tax=Oceanobacillus TaxID=182709 RepID=W9AGW9_9BACI|nr:MULTISPECIES: exodeoxyribonuclease VII small subunit [Oceanobacillus]AVQ99330.1 exodeoxyribonuclease VII small subunit [Oceanobacillus iheyensis]NAP01176.1 exodeoxyribonuclease VII small subunit [Halomonas sp. MG34]MCG3418745.1 exodeoxyribonuclease VII small subunit [Oceanobacillus jordanicus]RIU96078.1 exodeoxyribonuclease VII small subunit [Oceanobacillus picturae]CDO01936.1 Exodeoxyribonuclease 7 small subunit [Oceanobacillus picturae]